ncbi:MAG: M23 family peptidase, partial [Bacteroidia bacterium]
MLKQLLTFLFLAFSSSFIFAQNPYPTDFFRSPTDGPLNLAGNFGEIRPNHLHAGFDVKTNNQEGKPIYAVADGFVSRIK